MSTCKMRKSWNSWKLDAGTLNESCDTNAFCRFLPSTDLESYLLSETPTLPPPAKFSDSRRKLLERSVATTSPLMSPPSSSTDSTLSFAFSDCSDFPVLQEDFFFLAAYAPQPMSPQKLAGRNHQRRMANFILGLQNEAERRRQANASTGVTGK